MIIDLSYWTTCLSNRQAANLASTLSKMLECIVENPSETVARLEPFSEHNKQDVMSWNSEITESVDNCVHNLIKKRFRAQPMAEAVSGWDAKFTYGEMDDLTTRLAVYLQQLGVKPETFVPIYFEKSAWTVIAMVAIVKAGGAFVPLHPSHPEPRLQELVSRVGAQIVLASRNLPEPNFGVDKVVQISSSMYDWLPQLEDVTLKSTAEPHNPAYVLFTSGSTGKPKGVIIEHQALCTSTTEHGKATRFNSRSRVLQFASYIFDACIAEIFTTLIHGGCICVPSENDRMNNLTAYINREQITWAFLTPSLARLLTPSEVPTIETLVVGGEAMGQDNIRKWSSHGHFLQAYGPTECCVYSAFMHVTSPDAPPEEIGRACGNRTWVVLPDNHDILTPVGCVGELLIEGPILARGYLKDAQKTSDSFIENPKWAAAMEPSATGTRRMYKSGDLVRYNSMGSIQFMGRKDTQIKINGQRIELGEIEEKAKECLPESMQVAIDLVTGVGSMKTHFLIAFLCSKKESGSEETFSFLPMTAASELLAKDLEASLSQILPTYMVPSLYIPLSHMPTQTSGKLDRRMLRDLVARLSEEERISYTPGDKKTKQIPTTPMEIKMQALWETILNKPASSVAANDSFFRIGGDSISAMRLVTATRKQGMSISIADVFRSPELSEMAKLCSIVSPELFKQSTPFEFFEPQARSELELEASNLCEIEKESIQDLYPCSPLQEALIALSAKQSGAYIAQSIFKLATDIDMVKFQQAWTTTVDTTAILRTRIIQSQSAGSVQVVVKKDLAWNDFSSMQDCLDTERQSISGHGKPLTRFAVIDQGSERHFVWTVHHSLYDGWSVSLILKRVEAAYRDSLLSEEAPYVDFIKYLSTTESSAANDYWRSQLSEATSIQFPQPPHGLEEIHTDKSSSHTFDYAGKNGSGITTPIMIRAAWALLVGAYSDSDDVIFGGILSGRNAPVTGISAIVGPTLTTVPIRVRMDRNDTIESYLQILQDQSIDMIQYEQTGLQNIKQLSSDALAACRFQNLLVVQPKEESGEQGGFWKLESTSSGDNFHTYPLVLECNMNDSSITLNAHHDANIISTWQVERILYQFEHVLNELTSQQGDKLLGAVELFSTSDLAFVESLNSPKPEGLDQCVHDVIQLQVFTRPEAEAICSWDGNFTYKQLDKLATRLAGHLITLGVGPEVIVPVCFEKSAWTIIAILGILKAGGAYVSIDPSHPLNRKTALVRGAGATVLLTSENSRDVFESIVDHVVYVNNSAVSALSETNGLTLQRATPKNPVFIVYTSGSTGMPKGIVMEHGAFCTSARAHSAALHIGPDSRVLQFAAYTYDVSMGEILTTLMRGGCICVPSDHDRLNDLTGAINRMQVSWTFLTPTVAGLLQPEGVESLKYLVLGGEHATEGNIKAWADKLCLINR